MSAAGRKLSSRAALALEVLRNGGSFWYALERNGYTGREQFKWRLRTATGSQVRGVGHATFHELDAAGLMGHPTYPGLTGSASYYRLKGAA